MTWSTVADECRSCGGIDRPHHAKGLCRTCYQQQPDYRARYDASKSARRRTPEGRKKERLRYRNDPRRRAVVRAAVSRASSRRRAQSGEAHFRRPREYWANRHELIHVRGERCAVCGTDQNLEAHHIIHEADGGGHEIDNLMVLCSEHHRGPEGVHAKERAIAV